MPSSLQVANDNFLAYSRLLRRLHQLIREAAGESEEADELRERMLDNWERMSTVEQDRARALSIDLKSLDRISTSVNVADSDALEPTRKQFFELRSSGDWDSIVKLLQTDALHLSAQGNFFMRGRAWQSLGDLETSILFYEEALKISPNDISINMIWLDALVQAGHYEVAERNALAWLSSGGAVSPSLHLKAAVALFDIARSTTSDLAIEKYPKLIGYLERALNGIERFYEGFSAPEQLLVVCAMVQLALAYEHIGQHELAIRWVDQAISIKPSEWLSLIARGYILYTSDQDAAARDFEEVLGHRGGHHSWAHYHLGHYYLGRQEWKKPLFHARSALELQPAEFMRASLHEWIAISLSELGGGELDEIRMHFQLALSYEPKNDRIIGNRELFEKAAAKYQAAVDRVRPISTSSETPKMSIHESWGRADLPSVDPQSYWGDAVMLRGVSEEVSARTSENLVASDPS